MSRANLPIKTNRHAFQGTQFMKPNLVLGVLALSVLAGCGSTAKNAAPGAPAGAALAAQEQRITDRIIDADYKGYEAQQARIKALNDSGKHPVKSYSLAKAQCWLDVSFHEYTRNDRSAFPQGALTESFKITEYLQKGGAVSAAENPANQTPLVNKAAKLRPDLWELAESLKKHSGYKCAEQLLACGEVELVHAGNEFNQQQWRHAKPYVQIAEDKLMEAKSAADACTPPPAPPAPPPPAPVPAPAPKVSVEKVTLNASALFKFDKRTQADLLPQGRAEMDQLAERIKQVYVSVERIDLVGYTDRLGSNAYNAKLSLDRAETVKTYLQSKGVTAAMTTRGAGEAEPVVQCEGTQPTAKLTQCLQPNRRVEISIVGVKK
jgi:OmpA-OmpF porin, OOP family